MGLVWAAIWWQIGVVRHEHGREAFLAAQGRRFDIFSPRSTASFIAADIVSSIVWIGLMIVVYESLAFGIYKVLCHKRRDHDIPKQT
jgi:hypothetical protein